MRGAAGILLALLSATATAQDVTTLARTAVPDEKEDIWSGAVSLGYADASGNSESSALNARAEARYDKERWHHIFGGTVVSAKQKPIGEEKRTTTEAYWLGLKTQYDLTARYYVFGALDWYKDRFSAYDHQAYETAGLGVRLLTGPVHTLDLEAGAGFRQAELQNGEDQDEGVGVLRGIYLWQISENASFAQSAGVLYGSDNTYFESLSEVKAGIVGNLNMVLGYTIKRNSDVEPDTTVTPPRVPDKTDRYLTVSLEYRF